MEIYHKIEYINAKELLVIYVNYPDEYEFSIDFNSMKKNVKNVANKIREYALKNIGKISDDTALLVLNGVVIGTLSLTKLAVPIENNTKEEIEIAQVSKEENIDITTQKNNEVDIATSNDNVEDKEEEEEIKTQESVTTTNTSSEVTAKASTVSNNNENKSSNENISNSTNNVVSNNTSTSNSNNSTSNVQNTTQSSTSANTQTNNSQSSSSSVSTSIPSQNIKLRLSSGEVIDITLEDYVVGVVAAEMPASFNTEALKAQAVAARTYALKKTASGAVLSATTSDQVYNTETQLRQKWGSSYDTYYNKIRDAVIATKGECLMYNGSYIEALYFSTSNGRTENAENVWGNSFPYLKSVESPWDVGISGYSQTKTIPMSEISSKLGVQLTSISQISINSKTEGDRVKSITICGKEFTGVEIRQLLGLRSADFDISESGDSIAFTTRGYGHGVGMSQYGANGMAKSGYSYLQILKHYYSGVSVVTK